MSKIELVLRWNNKEEIIRLREFSKNFVEDFESIRCWNGVTPFREIVGGIQCEIFGKLFWDEKFDEDKIDMNLEGIISLNHFYAEIGSQKIEQAFYNIAAYYFSEHVNLGAQRNEKFNIGNIPSSSDTIDFLLRFNGQESLIIFLDTSNMNELFTWNDLKNNSKKLKLENIETAFLIKLLFCVVDIELYKNFANDNYDLIKEYLNLTTKGSYFRNTLDRLFSKI